MKLLVGRNEFLLFFIYCRPSIKDLSTFLLPITSKFTPHALKSAIFCLDSNAKNTMWNSVYTNAKGKIMEDFFDNVGSSVANVVKFRPKKLLFP